MKQIINGKMYDTEKAECIASSSYGFPGDFSHSFEAIYKTKKGNYFFYGEGGPLSSYAVSVGTNETGGSERIKVMTKEEALEWIEDNQLMNDKIESEFADLIEEA